MKNEICVSNLHKISCIIEIRSAKDGDLIQTPEPFSFIFGVGANGMAPFENAIYGKKTGETINFIWTKLSAKETLLHIPLEVNQYFKNNKEIFVSIIIKDSVSVKDREIVKAMAISQANCGCGCGC